MKTRSSIISSRPPTVTERKATRAELEADLESEEGHVHGPGCGHDHAAVAKPKGKKPAVKAEKLGQG